MKSTSTQAITLSVALLSICSCQVKDDSVGMNFQSEMPQVESDITCEELLQSHEDFEGQEIELSAISWGTSPSEDGEEILMSVADEILQGLQQAHVLVHFSKDQKEEIQHFGENDTISLTARVGSLEYGAVRLMNPKISPN